MDQLSALKLIFKNQLMIDGDTATISHNTNRISFNTESMEIIEPRCAYRDVYNYILKSRNKKIDLEKTETFVLESKPTVKITEEEFMAWKNAQMKEKSKREPSGRELWLSMSIKKNIDE